MATQNGGKACAVSGEGLEERITLVQSRKHAAFDRLRLRAHTFHLPPTFFGITRTLGSAIKYIGAGSYRLSAEHDYLF